MDALSFAELQRRLVAYLSEQVRNGDMTERRLARITGVSQPHMHHVLCGKRGFSVEMADRVMRALHKDLVDFLEEKDIAEWNSRE
jgi:transcriptional regulator with XRE-family HTH domain